jgi:hypothetical protein
MFFLLFEKIINLFIFSEIQIYIQHAFLFSRQISEKKKLYIVKILSHTSVHI